MTIAIIFCIAAFAVAVGIILGSAMAKSRQFPGSSGTSTSATTGAAPAAGSVVPTATVTPPAAPATPIPAPVAPPPTPPAPTPAPATPARTTSPSWMGWAIAILAGIILLGLFGPEDWRSILTHPKGGSRLQTEYPLMSQGKSFPLLVRSGDRISLRADGLPWRRDAKYKIAFCLVQKSPGRKYTININGDRGGEGPINFEYSAFMPGKEVDVVFFESGRPGDPKHFVEGTNWIVFSPDSEVEIRQARIEVAYPD